MLPGNIFGLILKNKMAARDVYSTLNKDFCWPSRAKGIIGRDLKFAGYVPRYKILTGNIFGLILKNKMAVKKGGGAMLVYAPATLHWYPTIGLQVSWLKVNLGQREFSYHL